VCQSHGGLAIYIKKSKEEFMETQIFHHAKKNINLQKILLKKTKILQDIL
jgi:hypothetical protein